jgi:hypothetical protein
MKYLIYFLILASIGLMIYCMTMVNYDVIFSADNRFWLIGFGASLCAMVLLLILIQSRKLKEQYDKRSR